MDSGDYYISDESSFYGDEEEQERLLELCDQFNPSSFWSTQDKEINHLLHKNRPISTMTNNLRNPREGQPDSWQIGETADEFVNRLSPLKITVAFSHWLCADNPFASSQESSQPQNLDLLSARGHQLLQDFTQTKSLLKSGSKFNSTASKKLRSASLQLQEDIAKLAGEAHITAGKWMLFPSQEDVTRIWRLVVDGTINNHLGCGAKVATDDGRNGERLMCIYTKDFRDRRDVLRILKELVAMQLVSDSGRPIYYKADVYTHLGIYRDNAEDYGLQASLYGSKAMLAQASLPT